MADSLKVVIDSAGRTVDIEPGQWEAMKASITTGMQAVVGEVTKVTSEITKASSLAKTEELLKIFTEFKTEQDKDAKFQTQKLTEISNHLGTLNSNFAMQLAEVRRVMQEVANNTKLGTGTGGGGGAAATPGSMDLSGVMAGLQTMNATLGMINSGVISLGGFLSKLEPGLNNISTGIAEIRKMGGGSGWYSSDTTTHKLLGEIRDALIDCCPGGTAAASSGEAAKKEAAPAAPAAAAPTPLPATPASAERPKDRMKFLEALRQMGTESAKTEESTKGLTKAARDNYMAWERANTVHRQNMQLLSAFKGYIDSAQQAILGFSKEMGSLFAVFQGVIGEETKFIKESRAVLYEVQGITGATHGLQDAFTDIGKTVKATGFNRSDFQKSYLDNVKKGIRDQKMAHQITVAQLNTEKQLGLEAGELGDTFAKYANELNMSGMQIAQMGRNMRDVARYTGLTGKELAKAVQSSGEFLMMMRNAATLTASASRNIMELSANVQKMGVDKAMQPLMRAMSSTTDLFYSASNETKALLFQAASHVGRVGDLMAGTVLKTKGGMKDMAKGMETVLKKFGVESVEAIDTLSDGAKMKLNLQLKAAFGIELGEFQQSLKALKESSKSVGERLDDINKKQQANLTTEERIALAEEARRLKTSKSLEIMTALDEAAKGAKDMNSALAQFGKRKGEFEGDLKSMGKSWGSNAEAARGAINEALKGVNESLKASGKSELKIDSSEIDKAMKDPQAFRELSAKLSKAEQEAATAQKAALDPMSKIEQGVHELNDTMRDFSSKFLSGYMNLTGVLGLLVPAIGLLVASQAIAAKSFAADVVHGSKANPITGERDGLVGNLLEKIGVLPEHPAKAERAAAAGGTVATATATGVGAPVPPAPGSLPGVTTPTASPAEALKSSTGTVKTHDDTMMSVLQEMLVVLRSIEKCVCHTDPREEKALKNDLKNAKLEKEADKAQIAGTKSAMKEAEEAAGGAAEGEKKKGGAGGGGTPEPAEPGLEGLIKKLQKDGPNAAKLAGILAIAAVGIVVLGIVLMKLCSMLLSAINLDIGTVLKTVGVIVAVAGAAAALGVAVYMSKEPLEKLSEMGMKPADFQKMGQGALLLMILGPALVLLATAILSVVRLIGWMANMDWSVALQLAANMAAVIGAAGALGVAVSEAKKPLEELGKIKISDLSGMGHGALIIMILAPAMMLMATALVLLARMCGWLVGENWMGIIKVAVSMAIMLAAAGALGAAIYYGQDHIEKFSKIKFNDLSKQLWDGAKGIARIIAPMIAFAAIVWLFGKVVVGGMGLTPARMAMIAASFITLTAGMAGIAYALENGAKQIEVLGKMAPTLNGMQGTLWQAVGAFGLVTLPLVAFAAILALFGWVVIDGLGLTPARMFEVAATWLILAVAVGAIAYAIIFSMPSWASMAAAVSDGGATLSTIMWTAAYAFALISLPVMAFGAAMALFGWVIIDGLGLDPGRMLAIAATWLILAAGVAGIAYALTLGLPAWMTLGAIAPLIWSAYGLIWAAVGAFALVTIPILAFAAALTLFGYAVIEGMGLTPGRMLQVAATWLILGVAVGLIGYAITGALPGWLTLGATFPILWALNSLLWLGVAAFALISAPIIVFAGLLALFGEIVIDGLGLDFGRMLQIAATWLVLGIAVGLIGYAIIGSAPGWMALGSSFPILWWLQGLLWLGVAAFGLVSLPIVAFATLLAAFGEIVIDGLGLTFGRMLEIAGTWLVLGIGVGLIGYAILGSLPGWLVLGTSFPILWALQGLMWLGVAAFALISAPILALAAIIAGFGEAVIDDLGLTSGRMEEIGKTFADLAFTIGELSWIMMGANASLAYLGLLYIAVWLMSFFAEAGISAFNMLSEPILRLAGTIAGFGETLIDDLGLTSGRMEEISKTFITLTDTVSTLSRTMMSANKSLSMLGLLYIFSGMFIGFAWLGVWAFRKLAEPLIALSETIAEFGDSIDVSALQNAARACEEIAKAINALPPVFDSLMNGLYPLTQGGWFFGKSILQKILEMRWTFAAAFWAISSWLMWGIVLPIQIYFPDPAVLDVAAKQATSMASVISSLPPIFDALMNGLLPLMKGGWFFGKSPIKKILGMREDFKAAWWAIAQFLSEGIVSPILTWFDDPASLDQAAKQATSMASLIATIPPIITGITDNLMPLMKPKLWGMAPSKMQKALSLASGEFKQNFEAILRFIATGIVDPIFNPEINLNPTDIGIAAKAMQGMAALLPAIPPVIEAMNGPLAKLMRPGIFGGKSKMQKALAVTTSTFKENLKAILSFIATGIIDPIFDPEINLNPTDIGIVAKSMKGLADLLPAIPTVIEAMNGPLARLMKPGIFGGKSKMSKALDVTTGTFKENLRAILSFIATGIIDPIFDPAINLNPRDIEICGKAMKGLADLLPAIPIVIEAMNGPLQRLMNPGIWGGKSKIDQALDMVGSQFAANLRQIFLFIGTGIIDPVFEANLNPRDIQFAADAMKNTAGLLPAVAQFINRLGAQVQAILGSTDMQMKMSAITQFATWFANVSKLLTDGMITPIKTMFPPPEEVADMSNRLRGMNQLVAKLPDFMKELYGHMARGVALIDNNEVHLGDVTRFSNWFSIVAWLLKDGIIDPLNTWPKAEEIGKASEKVDQMSTLMSKVPTFMSNLYSNIQAVLARINAGDIQQTEVTEFTRWFSAVAWLLDYGVIFPIKYLWPATKDIGAAAEKVELMGKMMAALAPMVGNMATAIAGIRQMTADGGIYGAWKNVAGFMWAAGWMAQAGLIDPLRSWPADSEIQDAITRLTALDELFRAMAEAMQGVAQAAAEMQSVNINAEIEGFNAPDTGFIDAINEAYDDIMAKQAGAMNVGAFDPKILQDAGASATDQMAANATSLQGTLSELLSPKALSDIFAGTKTDMSAASDAGGFTSMISSFVDSANSQMGMSDTNALVDAISKQSPEITAMQSAIRQVENYTTDLKDLFERASHVIQDIQKTTEYMAMFGDLDFYEKMIGEKVGASKQFVPTVQRIAEKIGKGFNFEGGKDMVATIAAQSGKIEEMKAGLTATEAYTRKLSEIFAMANNTINQIRTTTQNLDALASIREVEANIVSRVASGNSFMTSIMKTVEAVATNFGSNQELTQSLTTVQEAIRRAGDTSQAMTDALTFIETVRQLQTSVMQVGQAAAQTGGQAAAAPAAATGTQTGGAPAAQGGQQQRPAQQGGTTGSASGGLDAIVQSMAMTLNEIKAQITICADSLRLMMTEATTRGSLYVADHAMVKTTEGTQETIVKGDNKIKEATISTTERTASALEQGNAALAETIDNGQQNMTSSIENANQNLSSSISSTMATSQESLTQSISQANENLANSMTNLNTMLGSVLQSLQTQNQSATTNANNAANAGATTATGDNTTNVTGPVSSRNISGGVTQATTSLNQVNWRPEPVPAALDARRLQRPEAAAQPNAAVAQPARRRNVADVLANAPNAQAVIAANPANAPAMTNINSQNLTGPAMNNVNASATNAITNANTQSMNESAMTAVSNVAAQDYNAPNLLADSPKVKKVELSRHRLQGVSPAGVAADLGGDRAREQAGNNWVNMLGDSDLSSAVSTALGGNTVTNANNMVGGPQGIAGDQSVISQALSSTMNTSRSRNTTLGGGVPGAGMPLPTSQVNLATPEPVQTAAHTAATTQNIQSQIMQDRATAVAPTVAPGQTQDNSMLQGIMQDGNVTAEGILAVLNAMYQMMKPKTGQGGAATGDTRTKVTSNPPASFFRAPCGDFQSSNGASNMARIR